MDSTTQRIMTLLGRLGDSTEDRKLARALEQDLTAHRFQVTYDAINQVHQAILTIAKEPPREPWDWKRLTNSIWFHAIVFALLLATNVSWEKAFQLVSKLH